jgi:DNA-binding transcriptional regulator/RsmH inhibitor MraZ
VHHSFSGLEVKIDSIRSARHLDDKGRVLFPWLGRAPLGAAPIALVCSEAEVTRGPLDMRVNPHRQLLSMHHAPIAEHELAVL